MSDRQAGKPWSRSAGRVVQWRSSSSLESGRQHDSASDSQRRGSRFDLCQGYSEKISPLARPTHTHTHTHTQTPIPQNQKPSISFIIYFLKCVGIMREKIVSFRISFKHCSLNNKFGLNNWILGRRNIGQQTTMKNIIMLSGEKWIHSYWLNCGEFEVYLSLNFTIIYETTILY